MSRSAGSLECSGFDRCAEAHTIGPAGGAMTDRGWSDSSDDEDPFERGKPDWAFVRWILLAGFVICVIGVAWFSWAFAQRNP